MDVQEKLNPFYNATKSVFKSMLDLDVTPMQNDKSAKEEENIKVQIDLIGDLFGSVVFNFPKSTTLNIVKTLSGMETEQVDDFATSMLGEIANIISGNAVSYLSDMHYNCDIKPPQISIDKDVSNGYRNSLDMFLHSPAGELCEHVNLSNKIKM